MGFLQNVSDWCLGKRKLGGKSLASQPAPLREFIYLDEVSLRSLLASQQGAIEDAVSEAFSNAENAELAAELSADAVVGKGKINSRYQTSNSRSIQTTRKVIAQSLFKSFKERNEIKIHFSSPPQNMNF